MNASACFAQSYAEARLKFLAAATAAGLDGESHPHPLPGRDGEPLAMDVARDGPADAPALLIISSACHGVEGFCGSGCRPRCSPTATGMPRLRARRRGGALHPRAEPVRLLVVAPHDARERRPEPQLPRLHRPLPANPAYDELAAPARARRPGHRRRRSAGARRLHRRARRARRCRPRSRPASTTHPHGLFYGGRDPTWSQRTLRHVLREHGRALRRLGWIDLHTGLGPSGHGERIFACRDDAAALARARAWWGDGDVDLRRLVTSALLTGLMWRRPTRNAPQAEYTGIALEYGTLPIDGK